MPGSIEKAMPFSSRVALPSTMYGSSWVSRPMPWPVRWMNHSPYPASSMMPLAAWSTLSAVTPGLTLTVAASWARLSTS